MKLVDATCVGGVVSIDGVPMEGAKILTDGNGASEGVALIQKDAVTYIVMNTSDLKDLLDSVRDIIDGVVDGFNAIAGGMTGSTTAPPPTLPSIITQLNAITSDLTELRADLK